MEKRVGQLTKVFLLLFLAAVIVIAIFTIWDVVTRDVASQALRKVTYSIAILFVGSLIAVYLTKNKRETSAK